MRGQHQVPGGIAQHDLDLAVAVARVDDRGRCLLERARRVDVHLARILDGERILVGRAQEVVGTQVQKLHVIDHFVAALVVDVIRNFVDEQRRKRLIGISAFRLLASCTPIA